MKYRDLVVRNGQIVRNSLTSSFLDRHTPNENGSCKTEGCKGFVEKRVSGVNSHGFFYKIPACSLCGREYLSAINAPVVGMKEFQKVMSQVY
jgi:hypothetical protein